jgi:hypothetical protein
MYACMYVCMYVCMRLSMYVYMYVCMYVCVYISICYVYVHDIQWVTYFKNSLEVREEFSSSMLYSG